ncbi:hypothetical protein RJ640_002479, partial [Escallonia rubra]
MLNIHHGVRFGMYKGTIGAKGQRTGSKGGGKTYPGHLVVSRSLEAVFSNLPLKSAWSNGYKWTLCNIPEALH